MEYAVTKKKIEQMREDFKTLDEDEITSRLLMHDGYWGQRAALGFKMPEVVLDIGACDGDTVNAYAKLYPDAKIYAFEPVPALADLLRARFKDVANVEVIEAAVGHYDGRTTFNVHSNKWTGSLLRTNESVYTDHWERDTVEVDMVTLDAFCDSRGIEKVDIIKCDAQGGEALVIAGAARLLHHAAISVFYAEVLFVEFYTKCGLYQDITFQLDGYDYSLYRFYDVQHAPNGQVTHADGLFVSPACRKFLDDELAKAEEQYLKDQQPNGAETVSRAGP
jgi:FkbM family methyltransferase